MAGVVAPIQQANILQTNKTQTTPTHSVSVLLVIEFSSQLYSWPSTFVFALF